MYPVHTKFGHVLFSVSTLQSKAGRWESWPVGLPCNLAVAHKIVSTDTQAPAPAPDVQSYLIKTFQAMWQEAASSSQIQSSRSQPLTEEVPLGQQMALQNQTCQLSLLLHRLAILWRNWQQRSVAGKLESQRDHGAVARIVWNRCTHWLHAMQRHQHHGIIWMHHLPL